jgi:enolase
MGEDDVAGWRILTEKLKSEALLVGDDLFVTNKKRLIMGKTQKIANAILIKPNQIGTLSEVIETVDYAKANGYKTIMSHRSGETADTFISDLAVALGCELIKTGAPARSERTEKYNRLMKIESEMFNPAYAGELF